MAAEKLECLKESWLVYFQHIFVNFIFYFSKTILQIFFICGFRNYLFLPEWQFIYFYVIWLLTFPLKSIVLSLHNVFNMSSMLKNLSKQILSFFKTIEIYWSVYMSTCKLRSDFYQSRFYTKNTMITIFYYIHNRILLSSYFFLKKNNLWDYNKSTEFKHN